MTLPAKKRAAGTPFEKAWSFFDDGNYEKAIKTFESALHENADKEGFYGLGCAAYEKGDLSKASAALKSAIKHDPSFVEAYRKLGDIQFESREFMQALENYSQAVAYDLSNLENAQKLIDLTAAMEYENTNPNFKGLLTACLESPDLNFWVFGFSWYSILKNDKKFSQLLAHSNNATYDEFKKRLKAAKNLDTVLDPFFLYGLGRFIVGLDSFEKWICYLRRYMLEMYMGGKKIFPDEQDIEFLHCAISRYAFFTDYIFFEAAEESKLLETLKRQLESTDTPDLSALALYGCYNYVYKLKNARAIAENLPGGDHVSQIPKSQIEDYLLQEKFKKEIIAITPIQDEVSAAVQEQYEEFPYPRWEVPFRNIYNPKIEDRFSGKKAKILIAGTGTGKESIELSFGFPDAEILAVDLSRTSLSYAMMRAKQLGVTNITFRQADINELRSINQTFDYITSSGVLHHMKEPEKGLQVLLDLLRPGGLLRIALYSRLARLSVIEARRIIADKNIGNDTRSIREFRRNIGQYMNKDKREFFRKSYDYFSLPMCRDLIFHVQEHQFDLLQIKDILERYKLKFLGFNLDNNTFNRYRLFTMGRDESMTDLDLWNAYEEENPDTFAAMYAFWCEKQ